MAKLRVTGKCKLCGLLKELCDSHYLPKGMYKAVRAKELKNPNPVMGVNGKLKQVSDQYRGLVLCADCEQHFNVNGERWVVANTPHAPTAPFALQDALRPLGPIRIEEDLNVYDISKVNAFNVQKLIYFGISIFWRGAVHEWQTSVTGQRAPEVNLGAYEEPIRRFLLGENSFPANVALKLDVWPFTNVLQALNPVVTEQRPEGPRYWFYVPGLIFFLYVGTRIPEYARLLSLTNSVIALDTKVARSVNAHILGGVASQRTGPKIEDMVQEVAKIRPTLKK